MDKETKQQKQLPVGIQTFSAYWHNMKTLTWRCAPQKAVTAILRIVFEEQHHKNIKRII